MNIKTRMVAAIGSSLVMGGVATVVAQDVMLQHLPFLKVLAEDDKVRVLRYAPGAGEKSTMHSHPEAVVVVLKGGRVKYTFPDGTQKIVDIKSGDVTIRPAVTHADEAIDSVESILVELKH